VVIMARPLAASGVTDILEVDHPDVKASSR
jgi:hypothetical protein